MVICGILGYKFLKEVHSEAMVFIEQLFLESQIRGVHATGFTFLDEQADGSFRLKTEKAPGSALRLLSESKVWESCKSNPPRILVGHTRYSTSGDWEDNRNNQPLATKKYALVHNGLVSMATPEEYAQLYEVPVVTENDSEIILKSIMLSEGDVSGAMMRINKVHPPVFACGLIDAQQKSLKVWRDNLRPLWIFYIAKWDMIGFASTKDIVKRALKASGNDDADPVVTKLPAFRIMELNMPWETWYVGFDYPDHPKFERPNLIHKQWLRNKSMASLKIPKYDSGDCRLNPREAFKRYSVAAITSWEIDPNYPLLNYIFQRYELSKSQEYWACWLYGVFYHPGSVFWFMQEFPEYEKVDLGRLERWHQEHWRELRYNTDRKYEKGHLVEMFVSYRDMIGSQTPWAQEEFFSALLKSKDSVKNFHVVFQVLSKNLLRFGRYATYIYTEALARCMGMPIQADTVFLKEARSPRAGLCYALKREDWAKAKLTPEQWGLLEQEVGMLLEEIKEEYPDVPIDHWLLESCLCAFKGFFRPTKGRYIPYYLDRQADEFLHLDGVESTSGVYWNLLWQFRRECIMRELLGEYAKPQRLKIDKNLEHILRDTGRMIGLEPFIKRGILDDTPISNKG